MMSSSHHQTISLHEYARHPLYYLGKSDPQQMPETNIALVNQTTALCLSDTDCKIQPNECIRNMKITPEASKEQLWQLIRSTLAHSSHSAPFSRSKKQTIKAACIRQIQCDQRRVKTEFNTLHRSNAEHSGSKRNLIIYIYMLVAKGLGCCANTSSFCTTKPGGLVNCYGTAAGRLRTNIPSVRISRPVISISHEATSWQVISSSRFYSGDEALCPVITRMDDCYSLSKVLVTIEIPNPFAGNLFRIFNAELVALTIRVYPYIVGHGSLLQFIKATNSSRYFCPEMLTTL